MTARTDAMQLVVNTPEGTKISADPYMGAEVAWLDIIRTSKFRIYVQQFYISIVEDSIMLKVLCELNKAADRGVDVWILLDKRFSDFRKTQNEPNEIWNFSQWLRSKNIRVAYADYGDTGRNHAKYIVADGSMFYVGSHNFDWRALEHIFEVGVVGVCEGIGGKLSEVFESHWVEFVGDTIKTYTSSNEVGGRYEYQMADWTNQNSCSLCVSGQKEHDGRASSEVSQILRITEKAESEIVIGCKSLLFQDKERDLYDIHEIILSKRSQGIPVRIFLDGDAKDRKGEDLEVSRLRDEHAVDVRYIRFPESTKGYIPHARLFHAKFLIVDKQKVWIGSANWTPLDFFQSHNVGVIMSNRNIAGCLRDIIFSHAMLEYAFNA